MGKVQQPPAGIVGTIPAGAVPSPASRQGPAVLPPPDPRSRELVRRLELSGLAPTEAGNVVAYLLGLRPVASGWRVAEIDHLRFLRALVADGRLES